MTLVLLVLAAVWALVLIPPALRARAEGRPGDSITTFRRELAVLRRAAPRTGRSVGGDHWFRSYASPAPPLATVSRLSTARSRAAGPRAMAVRPAAAVRRGAASAARSRTLRRRRDVLGALVVVAAATLVGGAIPALRVLWLAHVVADILVVAYVALLIRQRNVAAERDMKVRFLPGTAPFDPGAFDPRLLAREPALLRRSAN